MHQNESTRGLRFEDLQASSSAAPDPTDAAYLRSQAERCRRLARTVCDSESAQALLRLAEQYDARAAALNN